MRVLFLPLYPESAASARYRVYQFLPYLREAGIQCDVKSPLNDEEWARLTGPNRSGRAFWYHAYETPRRIRQLLGARRYDVVFLQKAMMSAYLKGMPALLRGVRSRLVYDIDDAVHLKPPHALGRPWRVLEDPMQVCDVMGMSRCVLAGNRWLVEAAEACGAEATYFPTVVDTDRFVPASTPGEAFRVGWIGTPSTTPTLSGLGPVLSDLGPEELILVGADPKQVHCASESVRDWRYDREVADVQAFSAGLLPQTKDIWTRGKCALKALLYMACGVPCIATPYGAVLDIIEPGRNGLFADTPEEWREALAQLRDPGYRQELGEAARQTVEERFSLKVAAPQLCELLEGLV